MCVRCVCFTILELMFFNRLLWSSKSIHPSTLPSDLSKNEFAVFDTKRPHPQKESSRRSQQLHVSLRGPGRAGGQLLFRPQRTVTPSPVPVLRQSADRRLGLPPTLPLPLSPSSACSPSQRLLGLSLALAVPDLGPAGPLGS